jgi:hypothetical protein
MPPNKKHHYVPQFYLKNFSADQKLINSYIKKRREIFQDVAIKDHCHRNYFYGKYGKTEKILSTLEGYFSKAINLFLDSRYNGESNINKWLLLFAAVQYTRSEKINDFVKRNLKFTFNKILRFKIDQGPDLDEDDEELEFVAKNPIVEIFYRGLLNQPIIQDLEIHKIINDSPIDLYTSDSPVVVINPLFRNVPECIGLALKGIQILIPLSPKILLQIYDPKVYSPITTGGRLQAIIKKRSVIQNLNYMTIMNAEKHVFFPQTTSAAEAYKLLN